jgi:hypothetical protein
MGDSGTGKASLAPSARPSVHRRSIANCCLAFPDANIPLGVILEETEFESKIAFFEQSSVKYNLKIEILPKTDEEVAHRIGKAFASFQEILKRVTSEIEQSSKTKLPQLIVDSGLLDQVEQAVNRIITDVIRTKTKVRDRFRSLQEVRVVENALVLEMYKALESASGQKDSMAVVIKKSRDECSKLYTEYNDRFSRFVKRVNGRVLKPQEVYEPLQKLHDALATVNNLNDKVLLAQAACRMYQENRWGAVVTVDYSDIYHNRDEIYKNILLTISDPLYLLQHLDSRVKSNFYPRDEAKSTGVPYTEFVKFPARPAHIA